MELDVYRDVIRGREHLCVVTQGQLAVEVCRIPLVVKMQNPEAIRKSKFA